MARQYRNLNEIAVYLRRSPKTIRRLVKDRHDPLPFRKIGGSYLFDVEKVDRWVVRQESTDGKELEL